VCELWNKFLRHKKHLLFIPPELQFQLTAASQFRWPDNTKKHNHIVQSEYFWNVSLNCVYQWAFSFVCKSKTSQRLEAEPWINHRCTGTVESFIDWTQLIKSLQFHPMAQAVSLWNVVI
jgi:hypothetical protein